MKKTEEFFSCDPKGSNEKKKESLVSKKDQFLKQERGKWILVSKRNI